MHPILFKLGDVTIASYGVLIQVALASAFILVIVGARKLGNRPDEAARALAVGLIGAYVGGRGGFVALNWGHYQPVSPRELIFGGGFLGPTAIVIGALCVLLFAHATRRHVGAVFDPPPNVSVKIKKDFLSLGSVRDCAFSRVA